MQVRRLKRTEGPALTADIGDRGGDEAVVLLHGAGESRHVWGPIARMLALQGRQVVALDLRGHGESENATDGDYRLDAFVDDLHFVLDVLGVARATIIGQRMGGLIGLAASAATWRERIAGLAMIDIGLDTPARRRERERALIGADETGYADLAEAAKSVAAHRPRLRSEAALRRVLQQQPNGRWTWRCDPAFSTAPAERRVDLVENGPALSAALSALSVPGLLVRHAESELLSSAQAAEMTRRAGSLRYTDLTGASHRHDALSTALSAFVSDVTIAQTPANAVDQATLRRALGCFATGVAILTTTAPDGRPIGLTANSFCSVSLDPPLVLFCLDRRAGSLPAFEAAETFAVNILHSEQRDISNRFVAKDIDRFAETGWETWEAAAPIIQDAMVKFECEKHAVFDGGDHRIFIGRVRDLWFDAAREPLLYFQGNYRRLDPNP